MRFSLRSRRIICALAGVLGMSSFAQAQSRTLETYVLFAQDALRLRRLTVTGGDLGVNDGTLYSRGQLTAPASDLVAGVTRLDANATCDDLFANAALTSSPACQNPTPFVEPIIADVADACEFPEPVPACDPLHVEMRVPRDVIQTLPPGVYGNVVVEGPGEGTLVLNGNYVFCNLRVSRNASVVVRGATTITVTGAFMLSNAAYFGPDPALGGAVGADDIKVFVAGSRIRVSRNATARGIFCGPTARMNAGSGSTLEGRFIAQTIRVKSATLTPPGGSLPTTTTSTIVSSTTSTTSGGPSTTTTTTTTTTSVPGLCGNGVLNVGEECDGTQFAVTCSSPGGALVCLPNCTVDRDDCPYVCGDGEVEGPEVCDGNNFEGATCPGSSTGAFLICTENCLLIDDSNCPGGGSTTTTTIGGGSTTTTTLGGGSTTTSTTTTTSLPGTCGNGVREGAEECDQDDFGGLTCSSPAGALLICTGNCTIDDESCGTLCGNGIIEGTEACDGTNFGEATCPGSSTGAFLACTEFCHVIDDSNCPGGSSTTTTTIGGGSTTTTTIGGGSTTTTTISGGSTTTTTIFGVGEVCGNCEDDDGDGAIDFEDDECCASNQTFRMGVRRGKMRPNGPTSRLRLKSTLATTGLSDPSAANEDVFIQMRTADGPQFLCARIPADRFRKNTKKKLLRFKDKAATVASAQGITKVRLKVRKDGSVRFSASGKGVKFQTPAPGTVEVTIGLFDAARPAGENRCSVAQVPFQAGRKGALVFKP